MKPTKELKGGLPGRTIAVMMSGDKKPDAADEEATETAPDDEAGEDESSEVENCSITSDDLQTLQDGGTVDATCESGEKLKISVKSMDQADAENS